MIIQKINSVEITDYEKTLGVELIAKEFNTTEGSRWSVSFKGGEIKDRGCLISLYGSKPTLDEAITQYCSLVSNRDIVFGAYTDSRREVRLPNLIHTKTIEI